MSREESSASAIIAIIAFPMFACFGLWSGEKSGMRDAHKAVFTQCATTGTAKLGDYSITCAVERDAARLDFVIAAETTWYAGRGKNGNGILCYDSKGVRAEAQGGTMRAAIDAAMKGGPK